MYQSVGAFTNKIHNSILKEDLYIKFSIQIILTIVFLVTELQNN